MSDTSIKIQSSINNPKSILFVIDYLHSITGGTERQLYLLIKGFVDKGVNVELVVLRHTPFTSSQNDFPCPISSIEMYKMFSISSITKLWGLRQKIVRAKIDVVHIFFNDSAICAPYFCKRANNLVITSRRDMGIWYTPLKLFILRLSNKWVDRIVCNSSAVAELTAKNEKYDLKKIDVIFNGIEPYMKRSKLPGLSSRDDQFVVGMVANIRKVKNFEDIIRAAEVLQKKGVYVKYVIIGTILDQPYYDSLVSLMRELSVENNFEFLGSLNEPRQYLHEFDAGVLTSESEGLSNTIIEYLDAGLPVVCSNVGGNSELIQHDYNGYLYKFRDVQQLALYLEKALTDTATSQVLSTNAKKSITRFSYNTMIDSHQKSYTNYQL